MGILDTAVAVGIGVVLAEAFFRALRFAISFIYVYKHREGIAVAKSQYKKAAEAAVARKVGNGDDDWASGGYR